MFIQRAQLSHSLSLLAQVYIHVCLCVILVVEDRCTFGCIGIVYPGYIDISVGLYDLMDQALANFCFKYILETGSQTPGYYHKIYIFG